MKIALASIGTRGDVQPYLALALELLGRGHEVTFATHWAFRQWLRSNGMTHVRLPGNPAVMTQHPDFALLKVETGYSKPLEVLGKVASDHLRETLTVLDRLAEKSDLMVAHPMLLWSATTACQVHRKPLAFGALQPFSVDAASHSPWAYGLGDASKQEIAWQSYCHPLANDINAWRQEKGLEAFDARAPFAPLISHEALMLEAYDSTFWSFSPTQRTFQTGAWFLRTKSIVPETLKSFMEERSDIACINLGGNSPRESQLTEKVIHLLEDLFDGVVLSGPTPQIHSSKVIAIESLPHWEVFPRCRLVVHHGGAGTTQTAAACEKPSWALFATYEQSFWADRLKATGWGRSCAHHASLDELTKSLNSLRTLPKPSTPIKTNGVVHAADLLEEQARLRSSR